MAALVCSTSARRVVLGTRCIVGRGQLAQLQLEQATVSAEHASVYFDSAVWKVRDLGSRNGTFLNGRRLDDRKAHALSRGDRLSFGSAEHSPWILESSLSPYPNARSEFGEVLCDEDIILWLPRSGQPEACVRFLEDRWIVEGAGGTQEVADGERLQLCGTWYRLELPPGPCERPANTESTEDATKSVDLTIRFRSSLDQEHVAVDAQVADQVVSLGARTHNFTLLCLAQRRLTERAEGAPEAECGWFYVQELREALGLDREALNLQLWRAVQTMKKAGLAAERLIERRVDSQQVRFGFADLVIEVSRQEIGTLPRSPHP